VGDLANFHPVRVAVAEGTQTTFLGAAAVATKPLTGPGAVVREGSTTWKARGGLQKTFLFRTK